MVVHNTAQNSSDSISPHPSHNCQSSDAIYCRERCIIAQTRPNIHVHCKQCQIVHFQKPTVWCQFDLRYGSVGNIPALSL